MRVITTGTTDIKWSVKEWDEQLYDNKFHNLDNKDKLIERYKLPKLTEAE